MAGRGRTDGLGDGLRGPQWLFDNRLWRLSELWLWRFSELRLWRFSELWLWRLSELRLWQLSELRLGLWLQQRLLFPTDDRLPTDPGGDPDPDALCAGAGAVNA